MFSEVHAYSATNPASWMPYAVFGRSWWSPDLLKVPNNSPNGCRRRALVIGGVRLRVVEELLDRVAVWTGFGMELYKNDGRRRSYVGSCLARCVLGASSSSSSSDDTRLTIWFGRTGVWVFVFLHYAVRPIQTRESITSNTSIGISFRDLFSGVMFRSSRALDHGPKVETF